MKTLKNCIRLSASVKIYVPSTVNIAEHCDTSEWVDKALKLLSSRFGGSTASKALGCWTSTEGDLVKEGITLVLAYADQKTLERYIDEVYEFCVNMKKKLSQEAIALEVNGELYLV